MSLPAAEPSALISPHQIEPPTFPAVTIEEDEGDPVHVAAWCPWCEDTHWHGAAGGGGNRGAHCATDRHSPLGRTGYDLEIVGKAVSDASVRPAGLMVGERRLHQVMDQAAGALRAVALRFMLGVATVRGPVVQKRSRRGSAWIFGADRWLIEVRGRHPVEGDGFIRLAASLYGVPPGVAAVRLLEAVTFDRLDEEAALGVANVIDAWARRGGPERASR